MKKKIMPLIMAAVMIFGAVSAMAQDNMEAVEATGGKFFVNTETGEIASNEDSITEMTIPAEVKGVEVKGIAYGALSDCMELKAVNADENSKAFSSENGVLYNKDKTQLVKYPEAKEDESFTIPETVTAIGDQAFIQAYNLKNVEIPEGVKTIGKEGFWGCSRLEKLALPASLESIGERAFASCGVLAEVTVPEENTAFASADGILYSKDKTKLVYYPMAKTGETLKIPEGITVIGTYAVAENYKIKALAIPEGVKTIESYAFAGSEEIKGVRIPVSMETIEKGAFAGVNALTDVYYDGTEAQWRQITINNEEDGNILLMNAQKHFGQENPVNTDPNAVYVFVNGAELVTDQPAVIVEDRTLVPLRAIFEALGAEVDWDGETRTVTSKKGDIEISLKIGEKTLYKNGEAIEIDVPAQIINDRTMVPVRAISEAYGCEVGWDGGSRTVTIEG